MKSHAQFHEDMAAGGHELIAVSPLEPSAQATSMRPDGNGGALVTEGPLTESAEQIVGFYLVESDDEADLRAACQRFAAAASSSSSATWPSEGDRHERIHGHHRRGADRWWTSMSLQERKDGYAQYARFAEELNRRGHKITGGAELPHTAEAMSIRPDRLAERGIRVNRQTVGVVAHGSRTVPDGSRPRRRQQTAGGDDAALLKIALEIVIVLKTRVIDRLRAATTRRGKAPPPCG